MIGLPQQRPPLTAYAARAWTAGLRWWLEARASYGNFVLDAAGQLAGGVSSWALRLDQPNPAADLRVKPGDDTAARACAPRPSSCR
ncbi:MAG: hypothetical protein IPM99_18590 [Rubrivivax sp.]|nr:hypothetical protein [Rubrivivax sp.]